MGVCVCGGGLVFGEVAGRYRSLCRATGRTLRRAPGGAPGVSKNWSGIVGVESVGG